MKKILLTLMAAFCVFTVVAEEIHGGTTDLNRAEKKAQREGKAILILFTGSDWCPPCIAAQKELLPAREFVSFVRNKVVFVYLDYPQRKNQDPRQKKQNRELLKKYNVESFPTFLLLSSSGDELKRVSGYGESKPAEFVADFEKELDKETQ